MWVVLLQVCVIGCGSRAGAAQAREGGPSVGRKAHAHTQAREWRGGQRWDLRMRGRRCTKAAGSSRRRSVKDLQSGGRAGGGIGAASPSSPVASLPDEHLTASVPACPCPCSRAQGHVLWLRERGGLQRSNRPLLGRPLMRARGLSCGGGGGRGGLGDERGRQRARTRTRRQREHLACKPW